ncbi:RcpC/CpaB family pilus assembly protein [Terrabacter sp. NPDC000476]|uniref:Flp pilus assembly protein CpaB n=1 Tax=Terrabacter sp. NPDC000476 TaxID=3154258 RepID=UPI0033194FC3
MNRRMLAALVALVLAAAGGGLVITYAKNADRRAVAGTTPVSVWVAQKLVPAGTTLKDAETTGLITRTQVPAQAAPVGSLGDIASGNEGLLALSDVQPGEYVLAARFGSTPTGEKAIEVPAGRLAVSVQLEDPAHVGTFVRPGSHIAVFVTYKVKALGDDARSKKINDNDIKATRALLPDALVIGVGATALAAPKPADGEAAPASETPSFLVTVAVTPEEAVRLVHGINNYTLYAGLRGNDVKLDATTEASDLNIFTGSAS